MAPTLSQKTQHIWVITNQV